MTPLPDALLEPTPFSSRSDIDVPMDVYDRIERMLDAIDVVHDLFPTPASRAARVGAHGFMTRILGRDRTISFHEDEDGSVVAGLRIDRTSPGPYFQLRLLRVSDAPGFDLLRPLPVSAANVDVVDNLRRFASFFRPHLKEAYRALHRERMRERGSDHARAVRERAGLIAVLLSKETDGVVTCDMPSPLSGLRIRPCGITGARFSFHDDLITRDRAAAWSMDPCLQIGVDPILPEGMTVYVGPVNETRDATRMDPLSIMRAIEGLPTA